MSTQPGYVTISAPYTGESVTLCLDDSPPTPSGDFGGWETVVIPRKRPVRYWASNPEAKLELQVLVEKGPGVTVTGQLRVLRSMGTGDDERRPRQVELAGQLPPLPLDRWVIDDVTWGEALYTRRAHLVRQQLTISLGEPPRLDSLSVRNGGRSRYRTSHGKHKHSGKVKHARIRKGETLQQFAARTLGNPSRWKDIAKIQKPPIRDPRKVKDGRKLRLP